MTSNVKNAVIPTTALLGISSLLQIGINRIISSTDIKSNRPGVTGSIYLSVTWTPVVKRHPFQMGLARVWLYPLNLG